LSPLPGFATCSTPTSNRAYEIFKNLLGTI
jgi:hypothetical protein